MEKFNYIKWKSETLPGLLTEQQTGTPVQGHTTATFKFCSGSAQYIPPSAPGTHSNITNISTTGTTRVIQCNGAPCTTNDIGQEFTYTAVGQTFIGTLESISSPSTCYVPSYFSNLSMCIHHDLQPSTLCSGTTPPTGSACMRIDFNNDCPSNPNYGSGGVGFIGGPTGFSGQGSTCATIDGQVPDSSYVNSFFKMGPDTVKIIGVTPTTGTYNQNHQSATCGTTNVSTGSACCNWCLSGPPWVGSPPAGCNDTMCTDTAFMAGCTGSLAYTPEAPAQQQPYTTPPKSDIDRDVEPRERGREELREGISDNMYNKTNKMAKFNYKKWVTDYKNGKPLFEAQKEDKEDKEDDKPKSDSKPKKDDKSDSKPKKDDKSDSKPKKDDKSDSKPKSDDETKSDDTPKPESTGSGNFEVTLVPCPENTSNPGQVQITWPNISIGGNTPAVGDVADLTNSPLSSNTGPWEVTAVNSTSQTCNHPSNVNGVCDLDVGTCQGTTSGCTDANFDYNTGCGQSHLVPAPGGQNSWDTWLGLRANGYQAIGCQHIQNVINWNTQQLSNGVYGPNHPTMAGNPFTQITIDRKQAQIDWAGCMQSECGC